MAAAINFANQFLETGAGKQGRRLPTIQSNANLPSAPNEHEKKSNFSSPKETERNPFRMPSDSQVFSFIEKENNKSHDGKEPGKRRSNLYESKRTHRRSFKHLMEDEKNETHPFYNKLKSKKDGDALIISQHSKDRHMGKENLHEFVVKKREMFLLQYSLGVKKDEIKKLEQIAQAEEQKLLDDERSLEEDAAKFDAFLKENDKNSVEAIKRAEAETKAKLEKMAEIKKLNNQIIQIRSEMSKNEDQLKDYQRYRQFLEKLTPVEWLKQYQKQKPAKTKTTQEDTVKKEKVSKKEKHNTGKVQFGKKQSEEEEATVEGQSEEEFHVDESSVPPLYFTEPQQLLDLFAELEESNLELIQNCQETEETLEELKITIQETEKRMAKETESLRSQIEFLNHAISKEEEKARQLEERSKLFISSLSEADQERILNELNQKVKEVYRKCLGDADTNISTLQMLTSIENRLEQLFETIELMPAEKVEKAERLKDKERRHRLREEKMDAQRILQEERIQRALERARAPVKKKTGKPVVFRSAPPQRKKKRAQNTKNKEEEDLAYYWE